MSRRTPRDFRPRSHSKPGSSSSFVSRNKSKTTADYEGLAAYRFWSRIYSGTLPRKSSVLEGVVMTRRYMAAICALLLAFLSSTIAAQEQAATAPRTVQLEPWFPDPIKIVRVMLDGVEVKTGLEALPTDKPGVPFQAGDEWFNHLTVVLKNVSTKEVVYAGGASGHVLLG